MLVLPEKGAWEDRSSSPSTVKVEKISICLFWMRTSLLRMSTNAYTYYVAHKTNNISFGLVPTSLSDCSTFQLESPPKSCTACQWPDSSSHTRWFLPALHNRVQSSFSYLDFPGKWLGAFGWQVPEFTQRRPGHLYRWRIDRTVTCQGRW